MWVVLKIVAIAKVIAKASAGVCEAEFAGREGHGASWPPWLLLTLLSPGRARLRSLACLGVGMGGAQLFRVLKEHYY